MFGRFVGRFFVSFLVCVVMLAAGASSAQAATGYIDPNGDGSAADWTHTGSAYYTEVDEATRQPTTPTTSDYISEVANSLGALNLRTNSISSVASVSQVKVWLYHNDGSNGQITVQLYDDDEATTRSGSGTVTQRTSNTWDSVSFSGLSLTQTQLDALTIRLTSAKVGGGKTATINIYAIYAEVTYSPQAAVSISLTSDGTVAFGTQVLNTTRDTTSGDLNDVQTVHVDAWPAALWVKSNNFSDGSNTWSLASAAGSNQVKWEFSPNGSSWTSMLVPATDHSFSRI